MWISSGWSVHVCSLSWSCMRNPKTRFSHHRSSRVTVYSLKSPSYPRINSWARSVLVQETYPPAANTVVSICITLCVSNFNHCLCCIERWAKVQINTYCKFFINVCEGFIWRISQLGPDPDWNLTGLQRLFSYHIYMKMKHKKTAGYQRHGG